MKPNQSCQQSDKLTKTIDEIRFVRQLRLSEILMKQTKFTENPNMAANKLLEAMGKFIV